MRDTISARFLLATKPAKRDVLNLVGCTITKYPAKIAAGVRKVRSFGGAAKPTDVIAATADRRVLLNYAAR